jgi:flagellin
MALRINNNIASLSAQRNLARASESLNKNFLHLSTGLRIATAADDSAGLGISERMRTQIRSLNVAIRNSMDGVSMVQTGEGALGEISNILGRLRELAVQASNGTISSIDRDTLDLEFRTLIEEVDRVAQATDFAGICILDGSNDTVTFYVGETVKDHDFLHVTLSSVRTTDLAIDSLSIGSAATQASISLAITTIDAAINTINNVRGRFGAAQNRLETTIAELQNTVENLTAAESRIRDVDIAYESAALTRNQILQQSAVSILSQANIQPQLALQLLQG